MKVATWACPKGPAVIVTFVATGDVISRIWLEANLQPTLLGCVAGKASAALLKAIQLWTEQYSSGRSPPVLLPLLWPPANFHHTVWEALCHVPFGKVVSYGELAALVGSPRAARAVGNACGKNPFPLVIPCHRVISGNGSIGGFSLNPEIKRRLLEFEEDHSLLA